METPTQLFLTVVASSFGLAYFVYGKRQKRLIPTFAGVGLMIYPYFVDNLYLFLAVGIVGLALPFVMTE